MVLEGDDRREGMSSGGFESNLMNRFDCLTESTSSSFAQLSDVLTRYIVEVCVCAKYPMFWLVRLTSYSRPLCAACISWAQTKSGYCVDATP